MRKLELLRLLGESYARTGAKLGQARVEAQIASAYFAAVANGMYPYNESRREWAVVNMQMFYQQEYERILIMKKLTR